MTGLKWFKPPHTFDTAKADAMVTEILRDRHLLKETDRWGEIVNTSAVGSVLAEQFKANHVITGVKDLTSHPEKGAVPDEVALAVLGADPLLVDPKGPEQNAARDCLVDLVWQWSSTNLSSPLNTALSELDGYILLETSVSRKRGTEVAVPKTKIRFITKDRELIVTYFANRALLKFERAAANLNTALGEVGIRQPQLALPLAKLAERSIAESVASISTANTKAVTAKVVAALTTGDEAEAGVA